MKRKLLIVISIFTAISAMMGGFGLFITNGLGMSSTVLKGSPFNSFIIPSLILFFIIGGTFTISFIMAWKSYRNAPLYSSIAGFALLIWIFTELYIIQQSHWLQILYFGIAIVTLILSILEIRQQRD